MRIETANNMNPKIVKISRSFIPREFKNPKNLYSENGNSFLQLGHIVNTASDVSSKPFLLRRGSDLF